MKFSRFIQLFLFVSSGTFRKHAMQKISAIIITHNEEKNIKECLDSLQGVANEIIVMDSFSTDKTKLICGQMGVRFYQQAWPGYGKQKNDAAALALYDYILSLDADESLSEELKQSILEEQKAGLHGIYSMNRLNNYYGKYLYHGNLYPDYALRIYNRNEISWSTRPVHETLDVPAGIISKKLKGHLLHKTKASIEEHVLFANKYSTLGAQVYLEKGKRASLFNLIANPFFSFIKGYFLKLGFLDGYTGFIVAIISAHEVFLKYSKLLLLQKK